MERRIWGAFDEVFWSDTIWLYKKSRVNDNSIFFYGIYQLETGFDEIGFRIPTLDSWVPNSWDPRSTRVCFGGYLICSQYDGRMGFFCCRCWSSKFFAGYIDPIDTYTVDPLINGSSMGHHIDPIDVWQFLMTHWSRFLALPYRRPRWKMALQNFPSFSPPAPWINGFGFQEGESWRWRFLKSPFGARKKNGHIGEYCLVVWNMTGLFSISYMWMSSETHWLIFFGLGILPTSHYSQLCHLAMLNNQRVFSIIWMDNPKPIDELHHFSRWAHCTTNQRMECLDPGSVE